MRPSRPPLPDETTQNLAKNSAARRGREDPDPDLVDPGLDLDPGLVPDPELVHCPVLSLGSRLAAQKQSSPLAPSRPTTCVSSCSPRRNRNPYVVDLTDIGINTIETAK